MKEKYQELEAEVIRFESVDVVVTSDSDTETWTTTGNN